MKIDDYNLSKISIEAENFKEDVQNIFNYGKYSSQVLSNTPPSWTARNGESLFFVSGTIKRIYFYNNNAWDYIEYNSGATTNSIKGWVVYSGSGTPAINASYNVTSVTRIQAGEYEIAWATTMSSAFYPVNALVCGEMGGGTGWAVVERGSNMTDSIVRVRTNNGSGTRTEAPSIFVMAGGAL